MDLLILVIVGMGLYYICNIMFQYQSHKYTMEIIHTCCHNFDKNKKYLKSATKNIAPLFTNMYNGTTIGKLIKYFITGNDESTNSTPVKTKKIGESDKCFKPKRLKYRKNVKTNKCTKSKRIGNEYRAKHNNECVDIPVCGVIEDDSVDYCLQYDYCPQQYNDCCYQYSECQPQSINISNNYCYDCAESDMSRYYVNTGYCNPTCCYGNNNNCQYTNNLGINQGCLQEYYNQKYCLFIIGYTRIFGTGKNVKYYDFGNYHTDIENCCTTLNEILGSPENSLTTIQYIITAIETNEITYKCLNYQISKFHADLSILATYYSKAYNLQIMPLESQRFFEHNEAHLLSLWVNHKHYQSMYMSKYNEIDKTISYCIDEIFKTRFQRKNNVAANLCQESNRCPPKANTRQESNSCSPNANTCPFLPKANTRQESNSRTPNANTCPFLPKANTRQESNSCSPNANTCPFLPNGVGDLLLKTLSNGVNGVGDLLLKSLFNILDAVQNGTLDETCASKLLCFCEFLIESNFPDWAKYDFDYSIWHDKTQTLYHRVMKFLLDCAAKIAKSLDSSEAKIANVLDCVVKIGNIVDGKMKIRDPAREVGWNSEHGLKPTSSPDQQEPTSSHQVNSDKHCGSKPLANPLESFPDLLKSFPDLLKNFITESNIANLNISDIQNILTNTLMPNNEFTPFNNGCSKPQDAPSPKMPDNACDKPKDAPSPKMSNDELDTVIVTDIPCE